MLRIDIHKESKFKCKQSIHMEIPGLISLLKLLILIQELILILELIPILESILIPRPILNPELTSESAPELAVELIPHTKSGRSDSELPPLMHTYTHTPTGRVLYLSKINIKLTNRTRNTASQGTHIVLRNVE